MSSQMLVTCNVSPDTHQVIQSYALRKGLSQAEMCTAALTLFFEQDDSERCVYESPSYGIGYRGMIPEDLHVQVQDYARREGHRQISVLYSALCLYVSRVIQLECIRVRVSDTFLKMFSQLKEDELDHAFVDGHLSKELSKARATTHPSSIPDTHELKVVLHSSTAVQLASCSPEVRGDICQQMLSRYMARSRETIEEKDIHATAVHLSVHDVKAIKLLIAHGDYAYLSDFFNAAVEDYMDEHVMDWCVARDHEVHSSSKLRKHCKRMMVMVSSHTHDRVRRLAIRQATHLHFLYTEAILHFLDKYHSTEKKGD